MSSRTLNSFITFSSDQSICRELERLNFAGEKPFKKPRAGEYASDAFYAAAKAAKLKFATEGLRKQLNEIYERVMMLNRISTGAAGGDSDDPEVSSTHCFNN